MSTSKMHVARGMVAATAAMLFSACGPESPAAPTPDEAVGVESAAVTIVPPTKGRPAPPTTNGASTPNTTVQGNTYYYASAIKWAAPNTYSISSRLTIGQPTVRVRTGAVNAAHAVAEMSVGSKPPTQGAASTEIAELGQIVYDDDPRPRLFVFYWTGGMAKCINGAHYNCGAAFHSTSSTIQPDMVLTPGTEVDLAMTHVDSGATAGWHFFFNGTDFGYILDSAWSGNLTSYAVGQFFGEVVQTGAEPCVGMGKNRVANSASTARFITPQVTVRGQSPSDATVDMVTFIDAPTKYNLLLDTTLAPHAVRFGGPYPASDLSCPPLSGDGDFDRDGKADFAVWRPSNGNWYVINSSTGATKVNQWGLPGDVPVAKDYDKDGKADLAVWRPSEGNWYIVNSSTGTASVKQLGVSGDIPVPADYDKDGKADLAVWTPSSGNWKIIRSSNNQQTTTQWGLNGDIPVPGDYDGDGKADLAVWRPSEGRWYVIPSTTGAWFWLQWGLAGDIPVPGDYDGDAKTDLAVWRPSAGLWYIMRSSTGAQYTETIMGSHVPVPADYDGDGYTDPAEWATNDNFKWHIAASARDVPITQWGLAGDIPAVSAE